MKKLLFLLFTWSFCMGQVFANEVYYSTYTPFSDWQKRELEATDTVNVEQQTRYLWYKINQIPGNYALFENGGQFLDDCYYSDLSGWSTIAPVYHESRNVEERTKYTYKLDTGIRYIHLTDVSGSYSSFRIPELRTMINGVDTPYTYMCNGCNDTFDSHIHNGNRYENWSSLANGGSLMIDLGMVYPVHQVELQFYIYDVGTAPKKYTVSFSRDGSNKIASQSYVLNFSGMEYEQAEYRVHNIYNMGVEESAWTTMDVTYIPYTNDFQLFTNTQTEYAYREKMCRAYTENKQYSDEYLTIGTDIFPYRDNNQTKVFYRYQTRDKLELADIKIVDKRIDNWDTMVLYSSKSYKVIEDIDWSKNGLYSITFQVGDLEVTKEIDVQLIENTIVEYKKQIIDLNNRIHQLQKDYQTQKINYEQQIHGLEGEISVLKQQLQKCTEDCEKDNGCLQDTIQEKNELLEQYEQRILELSNMINEYQVMLKEQSEDLLDLESSMGILQEQLEQLKNSNQGLENKVVEQEEKLGKLAQDIFKLIANNNEYQKLLQVKQDKLLEIEKNNIEYLKDIEQLKQQLERKNQLIEAYKSKIEQLSGQFNHVQEQIQQVIYEREEIYTSNIELQKYLQDIKKENIKLKEEKEHQKQSLEQCLVFNQKEDNLNKKLNNYMLKIRGENKVNFFGFYIVCLVLFVGMGIYKWKKKSNVK